MPTADELLGSAVAEELVTAMRAAAPRRRFTALDRASTQLAGLALRERVDLLADALLADLPDGYAELAAAVRTGYAAEQSLNGWMIWPVTVAIARSAVGDGSNPKSLVLEDFDDAMEVLKLLTPRLSAEFAIRIMLRRDLERALAIVQTWVSSPDPHVRRLATEGTRPYLPWAPRIPALTAQPGLTLPILDALHADGSEYVRRSVANHLNDLSRDDPQLVVTAAAWWSQDSAPTTGWVVRHGLRTLVKKGDADALALLGFTGDALAVSDVVVHTPELDYPGTLEFSATVTNNDDHPAKVAIDYVIAHRRANGTQSPKIFKLTTRTLAPGETLEITREHEFRPITTRRYYSGDHSVALQVNGVATESVAFTLTGA